MRNSQRIVWRLAMLATLTGCLLFFTSDRNSVTAFATCTTCDTNYSICEGNCHTDYNNCRINNPDSYCLPILNSCRDGCFSTYAGCIGTCSFDSGGISNPACGRGRTQCELDCMDGRQDCVANGGTTCGQDYQSCVEGCCS